MFGQMLLLFFGPVDSPALEAPALGHYLEDSQPSTLKRTSNDDPR